MPPNKMLSQNNHKYNDQSGNVFIIIMVGIFLFGALMFMFSRSAQQGTGNVSKQQAKLITSEILNYARSIESAVDRLRHKGCSENEISFENSTVPGYEHTPVTRDECKIFHPDGGKLTYSPPKEVWLDTSRNARPYYGQTTFNTNCVNGVGANPGIGCNAPLTVPQRNSDLIIAIPYLKEEICEEINLAVINDKTIPADDFNYIKPTSFFTGTFAQDSSAVNYFVSPNQTTGCLTGNNPGNIVGIGEYGFYHVLIAR